MLVVNWLYGRLLFGSLASKHLTNWHLVNSRFPQMHSQHTDYSEGHIH